MSTPSMYSESEMQAAVAAAVAAERRATLAAFGKIPFSQITTDCYQWFLANKDAAAPTPLQEFRDRRAAEEEADKEERGLNWKSLGDATEWTFPAGKYYIGDLCYVLGEEDYDTTVGEGADGFHTNGKHVIGYFSTYAGDGCYLDTKGRRYGVDAGIIGIAPAALVEKIKGKDEEAWGVLTFENEFVFGCTPDHTFYVRDAAKPENSFEIPTGSEESDEDEDEDEEEDNE